MSDMLVVVDMQNDFVTGSLGTKEAQAIVPTLIKKVKSFSGDVIFTQDTHHHDYLSTAEGKKLPVEHCIAGTDGWKLIPELLSLQSADCNESLTKNTFGSIKLAEEILKRYQTGVVNSVELIGVCTDICVVSNALLLKAFMPELPISVDSSCCAGVTPYKHEAALEIMRSCQIEVK